MSRGKIGMALIDLNLTDAEQKLVAAIKADIVPEIKSDIINAIIPAIRDAIVGLSVTFTASVSKKD